MKTIKYRIRLEFAHIIRARIREINSNGLSGLEVKNEMLRLLDNYLK